MAKKAGGSAPDPDEKFLNDAIKEGRARKQRVSHAALKYLDRDLQLRVATSDTHVARLAEIRDARGELDPIVLFYDPKADRHMIGDGWHRYFESRKRGDRDILAWVIVGNKDDALWYASCTNRSATLPRSKEDIKKVVMTLLARKEWWHRSDKWIASHVGLGFSAVSRYRIEYCDKSGLDLPGEVEGRDGRKFPYGHEDKPRIVGGYGHRGFSASIRGRQVYLGPNREDAKARLDAIINGDRLRADANTHAKLRNRLFLAKIHQEARSLGSGVTEVIACYVARNSVLVASPLNPKETVAYAAGKALILRNHFAPTARAVVICEPEFGGSEVMKAAIKAGVEFLTFDQWLASVRTAGTA